MIVKLRRAGYSYRQVCAELDARGIRPRHADHWEPSTLRKIALRA
jgi:Recombinase